MTSTKKSVVVAGLAIAGLALGACGGGTGAGTSAGASGGSGQGATTIKLVAAEYSKDHTKAFWDAFAKTYKEKTGNTLEVQVVSWDNIDQQSSTMIQNNQAPDILNLNAYASYAKDGLLYNSDEVLPAAVKSDILDTFVKYGTYQGKMYGFPDLSSARALFYNKTLFKEAGIANPPKTWDELEADAKKIAATGQHRLRPPARTGGVAGRVLHVAVQQRRRLEDRRQVGHQLGQERRDADLPQEAGRREGHAEQPGPHQPRRRLRPVQVGQGRHGRRLQPAGRRPRRGQEGRLRRRAVPEQRQHREQDLRCHRLPDGLQEARQPGGGQGLLRPLLPA